MTHSDVAFTSQGVSCSAWHFRTDSDDMVGAQRSDERRRPPRRRSGLWTSTSTAGAGDVLARYRRHYNFC